MRLFVLASGIAAALATALVPHSARGQEPTGYEAGVAARLEGRNAEAARLLTAWLAEHPGDTDALVQLAYADLALGRLDAAEAGFRAVLARAPDYADAQAGLALVAERRRSDPRATLLVLEGAISDVGAGQSDWREVAGTIAAPVSPTTTVEGRAAWYSRFGREDVEIGAAATVRAGEDLWLRAGIAGTPQADFRPEVALSAGADWRVARGDAATVLTFDARYEDFPTQHVTTLSPGIVQYFGGERIWLTARAFGVIPQGRDMRIGWLVRGDVQPRPGLRLFAGIADGPDTDLGTVTDVTSVFGGAEIPLGEALSLTGALARETRSGPADRTEFRLGIKARL